MLKRTCVTASKAKTVVTIPDANYLPSDGHKNMNFMSFTQMQQLRRSDFTYVGTINRLSLDGVIEILIGDTYF